ncbi:hypothetical protein TPHA_0J02850 [Tetrapisispora phaffii CBS 4417]|uniref:Sensitive to high expression protein 9, mitochondrial n=1 Tax=Tetrapisispora phaffii (strain ATCC 24235 / CBS 4417 / NBRC 1672 / NRRL Y-8282 / UCD 70-5) TaxID=1071381 RepID=G8BZ14_TETPH|nr:hypothetical protein TPHA_0J02850 [Tetrapisispora phaffii CBS 4417]CCE65106.1 hypothetical protein TPHA_0J02850 [Tetrapisispora phaffii CBS 4417]
MQCVNRETRMLACRHVARLRPFGLNIRTSRNLYQLHSANARLYATKKVNNKIIDSTWYTKDGPDSSSNGHKPKLRSTVDFALDKLKDNLNRGKDLYRKYSSQLGEQKSKIKGALREAESRFQEQEALEKKDSKLNYNIDATTGGKITGLPSEREVHRRRWARKLEYYLDSLQETIFSASKAFNDVTGYSSVQKLRNSIDFLQNQLQETKIQLKQVKKEYADAIDRRNNSQRELNELLQRKSSWSTDDLENFTRIYKDDSQNTKQEQELKQSVLEWEAKNEKVSEDLYTAILTRYHEEQIWSDKIRRTSSYSSFFLMGMNLFLFLVLQLFLEPWKRRRLTNSFEDKVKLALNEQSASLSKDSIESVDKLNDKLEAFLQTQNPKETNPLDTSAIWTWLRDITTKLQYFELFNPNKTITLTPLQVYSVLAMTSLLTIFLNALV